MGAQHRGRRGARQARRDDRAYREYVREEQRRLTGCIAGRMPAPFLRWVRVFIAKEALELARNDPERQMVQRLIDTCTRP
jgi:hypothetical protein